MKKSRLLYVLIVIVFLTGLLWAQAEDTGLPVKNTPPPPPVDPVLKAADSAEAIADQAKPLSPIQIKMQKVISVNFRATPIEDVIRTLADQGQIDVVKGPEVKGEVTALLNDIPLGEALQNILAAHGFGMIESANMLRIVPSTEVDLQRKKLTSKVYRITYADVKEVEKALRDYVSTEGGKVSSNPGTSNVIVTDTEEKIKSIDMFLEEVDRITPQIMVEAQIYDIASTDQLDLGIEWSAGRTTVFDPITGLPIAGAHEPFATSAFDSSIGRTSKTTSGQLRVGVLNQDININTMLTAKQDKINAKLLANPRILVLDNELASIKIVSQIPYQELTQTAGGGNIGTTSFKDVGVELLVTPHLTRDGMIRLKISPKFSIQTDSVSIAIPGANSNVVFPQPVVDSREAVTTALIHDGEVVVLGGLRKKDILKEVSKIPLLGDIPLVGALFRFNGEKIVNSELVVFIKPRLINNPVLTPREDRYLKNSEEELYPPDSPKPILKPERGDENAAAKTGPDTAKKEDKPGNAKSSDKPVDVAKTSRVNHFVGTDPF